MSDNVHYSLWKSRVNDALKVMKARRVSVTKIRVDFDSLLEYAAREFGGRVNPQVRAAWAAIELAKRHSH